MVGLVSNCIMELFCETLSLYYFIAYYEVALKTELKIAYGGFPLSRKF